MPFKSKEVENEIISKEIKELSFSARVKEEIAKSFFPSFETGNMVQSCCVKARSYGVLQCGRAFSVGKISIKTENHQVAKIYRDILHQICGLDLALIDTKVGASGYIIGVMDNLEKDDLNVHRFSVLDMFGHDGKEISLRINRANFDCEHCLSSYLMGAFLACGSISDPSADYHMEFAAPYYKLANDLLALMRELGLNSRLVERKGNFIIYLKESTQIEDCLTLIGAMNASLELMNIKIVKDIRNKVNRITNCESANISKTVTASMRQIQAINIVKDKDGLDSLPDDLREIAILRAENLDLSLRELGQLADKPLSRSVVNHRLQQIIKWADELSK